MEYVAALAPIGQVVFDLIQRAIAGKKLTADQIRGELDTAVNACVARISELAGDLAKNNATVDAELAGK